MVSEQGTDTRSKSVLVAFFSRPGENYRNGSIVDTRIGNTELLAKRIQDITDGDIFRIEAIEAYPFDYKETTERAKRELTGNARPGLVRHLEGVEDYDMVFLGYPNWWGTMPMPVFSFLEETDLSGMAIVPFCTHEGSGLAKSIDDIKRVCKDSKVLNGLAMRGGEVVSSDTMIIDWVDQVLAD